MVDPLDHVRAVEDAPVEPGVYRVVGTGGAGTDDDAVTLLWVVEDGSRVHSGVVVHLDREDLDALAPAGNPDAGLGRLRQVPGNLAGHPVLATGALVALAAGGSLVASASGAAADVGAVALAVGAAALWTLAR